MNGMKRTLALLLAALMIFALAACGRTAEKDDTEKKSDPKATPAPEFVYAAKTEPLTNVPEEVRYLYPTLVTDDAFYCFVSVKTGERELREGETLEWEGQLDVYENVLYRLGLDGSLTKMENYKPMAVEPVEGHDVSTGTNSLVVRPDGSFLSLENVYEGWSDAGEGVELYSDEYWMNYSSTQRYYLRVMDRTGAEQSCAELDLDALKANGGTSGYVYGRSSMSGEEVYLYNMAAAGDDKAIIAGDNGLHVFDVNTGAYLGSVSGVDWSNGLLTLRDGRVAVNYYGDDGQCLAIVDADKRELGESFRISGELYNAFAGGGDYDIYYSNGVNFFGYDLEKGEATKLFNWINCDVDNDNLNGFTVSKDGVVVAINSEWDDNYENCELSLLRMEKVPASSLPQKKILTLATQYLNYDLRKDIIRFNRAHDSLRIELRDYSEYNTPDDYEAGLTKLRTEILAGNCPDIIDLSGLPAKQMAAKGLLADLYPLIDADPEMSREDFFPSVLRAMENGGKLYATCSSFEIFTAIGASRIVGTEPGWTYAELMDALREMPEGCSVFSQSETRADVLQMCLMLEMDRFVDWNTGEVSFNSQDFIDLLNFARSFPAEFDWDHYEWSEEDRDFVRLREGRQLLLEGGVYNFDSLSQYENTFGGIDAFTFIGFPTSEGVGSMIMSNAGFAISEKCADKEAAWEFVRRLMTEEYQSSNVWEIPSNIHSYENKKLEAMTPTYVKDDEGHVMLDPETGEKLMESKGGYWDEESDEHVPIYYYTQEEIDKLEALINSTTRVYAIDQAISDIVNEQAEAFFSGQRTAEDVANLIQSKARIYVNEQR